MSLSIVTNVASLMAQENLRVNSDFQTRTIQRLTSGYRINSSADDAAGLAVANTFRDNTAELSQGVRNANDGLSTLQIVDGGLANISTMLDRLKTLATQSASSTFTGNRATLESEYSSLLSEINRQADNIGLGASGDGAKYNSAISVYIGGGGSTQANSTVSIDLSGSANKATSAALGIGSTNINGGGTNVISNANNLNSGTYLSGTTEALTLHMASSDVTLTIGSAGAAMTGSEIVDQLNNQLANYGVTASLSTDTATLGKLQFSGGSTAFTVSVADSATAGLGVVATGTTGTTYNNALYSVNGAASYVAPTSGAEALTFTDSTGTSVATVSLTIGTTVTSALAQINAAVNTYGIYAMKNAAGTGIDFQSVSSFGVSSAQATGSNGVFAADGAATLNAPATGSSVTGGALDALTKIQAAVTALGAIQGKVGAGENKLTYAIQLAESQISSYSAAESRVRDADVASEAANLTKAQVLQQASIAAMAQANSAPQAVLTLLKG
jgi:flagellin